MTNEPLALYIHWPFCLSRCPYCDFNAHVRDVIPAQRFGEALRRELAWEAARLGRRPLGSIFFGGGTPSLMRAGNGGAAAGGRARTVRCPGRYRNHAGSQSDQCRNVSPRRAPPGRRQPDLDRHPKPGPGPLAMLGRHHSVAQAIEALEIARRLFPRVSFDLIYARPGPEHRGVAVGTAARAGPRGGSFVAVSTDHRARNEIRGVASEGRYRSARMRISPPRCTTRRPRRRRGSACCRTRSPITRSQGRKAGIICGIGAMATMPASGPAPMAVWP